MHWTMKNPMGAWSNELPQNYELQVTGRSGVC